MRIQDSYLFLGHFLHLIESYVINYLTEGVTDDLLLCESGKNFESVICIQNKGILCVL